MNQFNLFDIVFLLMAAYAVLGACWRGLAREVLHTLVFTALLTGSYFYLAAQAAPATPEMAAKMLVNYGYVTLSFYVVSWIILKILAPVFWVDQPASIRERFWSGSLALVKIVAAGLALNLWYAMHTSEGHPLRLNMLPDTLRGSVVVQLSDTTTQELQVWFDQKTAPPITPPLTVEEQALRDQQQTPEPYRPAMAE
ncbi:MAG: hypothetical protein COY40_00210 [Alphaproteobacteria bacterium CG_4_10_14_0_8_um_filter_53_9]|nr:MAG: hypothetical protein COY40_00210 [Alphaproteobacteria bacterium CG_4_10_14_0_8_um_filter_53_9]